MHDREVQEWVWQALEQEWKLRGGKAASEDIYARFVDAGVEVPDHALNEIFDGWESQGFIRAPGLHDRERIRLHGARTIVRGIREQGRAPKSGEVADAADRSTMLPGELPTKSSPRVPHPDDPARPDAFDQIRRLAELRDEGLITPEEFEVKKRELLERL